MIFLYYQIIMVSIPTYLFLYTKIVKIRFKKFLLIITMLISMHFSAQQKKDSIGTDSIARIKQPVKIRLGFDAGKYIWAKFQNSFSYDFFIDVNFYKDYYLIVSGGYEKHFTDNNLLNYHTTGSYYKFGVMYNLYRNWLDMDNDICIGINYAYARFDYLLHTYRINQPGAVFTPAPVSVEQDFDNNSAQWLELFAQMQVETFKHLYLGYNVGVKYLVHNSEIENFTVTYIPGFFYKNTYSRFGFGMQYFISYRIKF